MSTLKEFSEEWEIIPIARPSAGFTYVIHNNCPKCNSIGAAYTIYSNTKEKSTLCNKLIPKTILFQAKLLI